MVFPFQSRLAKFNDRVGREYFLQDQILSPRTARQVLLFQQVGRVYWGVFILARWHFAGGLTILNLKESVGIISMKPFLATFTLCALTALSWGCTHYTPNYYAISESQWQQMPMDVQTDSIFAYNSEETLKK
jgi:hypothetical protein